MVQLVTLSHPQLIEEVQIHGGILQREWSSTALFVVKPGQRGEPGKRV